MTSTNFYEVELRRALRANFESGEVRVVGDSAVVFEKLANAYPASGSKIDWSQIPGSIECFEEEDDLQAVKFIEFFDEIVGKFVLTGEVIYIGDSATDFALGSTIESMRGILPELLVIPQHHYFTNSMCSWCMCLTMEGDMGFGFGAMKQTT
ncbi:hypothetical protein [Paraburkholderia sp. MM6662-R1]|uniref:hypothetical protein n=1 Tax=Paraburkholderia sp. MM6662-R1 TaxID=2991066 RepID=UPI003D21A193